MALKKNDFIELEFTGRVKDTGEIFDSNIKEDLEKSNLNIKPKPFIFSLGEGMFLNGVDDFLIGKELGKYSVELSPEKAFGKRDRNLIKIIPIKAFAQQNMRPAPGMMFNFDGRVAKVISVSGGRVIVDFNNPISGKTVVYDVNILRKIEDLNEKAKSLITFLFGRDINFKIEDKKITLEVEKEIAKFAELFKDKFKDILGLELSVNEIKKPEKTEAPSNLQKKSQ